MCAAEPVSNGKRPATVRLCERFGTMLALLRARSPETHSGIWTLMRDGGLSASQVVTLSFLEGNGPRTISEVVNIVGLTPSSVSALLTRLLESGLVSRSEGLKDRRTRLVGLSTKGRAIAAKIQEARFYEFAQALEVLTPRTRERLAAAIEEVLAELRPGD